MRRVQNVPDGVSARGIHDGRGKGRDSGPGRMHGVRRVRKELPERRSLCDPRRGVCKLRHPGLARGIEVVLHMLRLRIVMHLFLPFKGFPGR